MVWQVVLSELLGAISGLGVGTQLDTIGANIASIDSSIQTFKTSMNTDMDELNSRAATIEMHMNNMLAEMVDIKTAALDTNLKLANTVGVLTDIHATMELAKDELQVIGSRISGGDTTLTQALAPLEKMSDINDSIIAVNDKLFAGVEVLEDVGEKLDTVAGRLAPDDFSVAGTLTALTTDTILPAIGALTERVAPEGVSVWSAVNALKLTVDTLEATQTAGVNVWTDLGAVLVQINANIQKVQEALRPGNASAFAPTNNESTLKLIRDDLKDTAETLFKGLIRVDEENNEGEVIAFTTRLALIETAIKFLATMQTFLEMTTYDGTRVVVGNTVVPSDIMEP